MANGNITDEELAELVKRTEDAASAYVRGDMDRYLELTSHARGFTLMNPLGGHPSASKTVRRGDVLVSGLTRRSSRRKPPTPGCR